jgi:two-component system, chemotaxis family, sensor kinase CheA
MDSIYGIFFKKGVEDMADDEGVVDSLMNDPEIVEGFITESKEHLDTIEDDLLNLEKQKDNPDPELIDKVFRAIHSVKSATGFLGLSNMNRLALIMEKLLTLMRTGEILPEPEYIDALIEGADRLTAMLDNIKQSNNVNISKICGRLSDLLDGVKKGN